MAILIKLAPILLMIAFAWWRMGAGERAMLDDLKKKGKPLGDGPLIDMVQRFRGAMGVETIDVQQYDAPMINALAAPNGQIFLTRGLIDKYRSGEFNRDEIANVIAHEIGHLALGHHDRRKRAWKIETAAKAAIGAVLPAAMHRVGGMAISGLSALLRNGLSRQDEYEADAFAVMLMRRANLDPRAAITLLQKLDALAGSRGTPISWLMSHPPTHKRIEAVARMVAVADGELQKVSEQRGGPPKDGEA